MIELHHPDGSAFVLNADLIETVDETPDTVVRLTSGRRLLVSEAAAEVVELVRAWRRSCVGPSVA